MRDTGSATTGPDAPGSGDPDGSPKSANTDTPVPSRSADAAITEQASDNARADEPVLSPTAPTSPAGIGTLTGRDPIPLVLDYLTSPLDSSQRVGHHVVTIIARALSLCLVSVPVVLPIVVAEIIAYNILQHASWSSLISVGVESTIMGWLAFTARSRYEAWKQRRRG